MKLRRPSGSGDRNDGQDFTCENEERRQSQRPGDANRDGELGNQGEQEEGARRGRLNQSQMAPGL